MPVFWAARGVQYAAKDAASAGAAADRARRYTETIEDRLERALLTCEALWTLLRDKLQLTDEELLDRIADIDLSDGQLDGKVRRQPLACPKCNRKIGPRFNKCLYCGQLVIKDPFA